VTTAPVARLGTTPAAVPNAENVVVKRIQNELESTNPVIPLNPDGS
jgi:hypothetical protein